MAMRRSAKGRFNSPYKASSQNPMAAASLRLLAKTTRSMRAQYAAARHIGQGSLEA